MSLIEKNKNYILDITGMTHEGQGVGRIEGLAVFVDGVLEGEQAEVKIIKLNKSYAVGKLITIIKKSPNRTEPFCSAYKRCGGCNLQHMDYSAQLDFKTKLVKDNLERLGGLKNVTVHDTIGMQQPFNYRNKAQFPVATVNGSIVTGFYAARSHEVISSETCGIQDAVSDRVREIVSRFINDKGITAYNETTGSGLLRHIVIRTGFNSGEVMVVLVINGKTMPEKEELVRRLVRGEGSFSGWTDGDESGPRSEPIVRPDTGEGSEFGAQYDSATGSKPEAQTDSGSNSESEARFDSSFSQKYGIKSIYLNVNTENTNVIFGKKNILLYGSETITDTIGDYKFLISPHSFFQVNPVQTEVLYSKALEYAALTGNETVFDLYCGIGTISLFLSKRARKVYGVEVVEEAIADARKNADLNGVGNVEFIAGEAEKVVPQMYDKGIRADVVVLDPPRKGCDESLLSLLAEMQPKRIVYVSCNPATLARDLKYLDGQGYRAIEAQPVDMFPWSGHVETVALITRVKE